MRQSAAQGIARFIHTIRRRWRERSGCNNRRGECRAFFQVETRVVGSVPENGLLVCNYLSYSRSPGARRAYPSLFDAKSEVRQLALFGWLTAGLIAYELTDGDVSEEVCCWKDTTRMPHLINLLNKPAIRAAVR